MPKQSSTVADGTASSDLPSKAAKALPQIEAWEPAEVHRSQIKNAEYNPRVLSEKAKRKLKAGIKKLGLLGPPIWNARTGNIVGGHQRVGIMDDLKGTQDYRLTVAKVDLDEHQEKEANLLLNNPEAQGDWDLEKLEGMFRDNLDLDATGFDVADVYRMFGDSPLVEHGTEQIDELSAKLREARERYEGITKTSAGKNTEDFYVVVVFKDHADRLQFLEALKLDDNRFQDGRELRRLYGIASGQEAGEAD